MPVTDATGHVRNDGLGFAYQSMLLLDRIEATPPAAVFPEKALRAFLETQCGSPDATISTELAGTCAAAAGARLYTLVSLTGIGVSRELSVVLRDMDAGQELISRTHSLVTGQLNTVPGLIAGDLCAALGWTLSDEDRVTLERPQVGTDEDSALLGDLLSHPPGSDEQYQRIERFLRNNPRCLGAWRSLFRHVDRLDEALEMRSKTEGIVEDLRLEFEIGSRFLELNRAHQVIANLLPLAERYQLDPDCQAILARTVVALGHHESVERCLDLWQKQDPTYGGHLARGEFLLGWADARCMAARENQPPPGDRDAVLPDDVRLVLERARIELLRATESNSRDWQARVGLITISSALGLSRAEMERHFTEAIAANPACRDAWRRRLQYLSPFRHGSVEDIARLITECVETDRWRDGIPQLAIEAVHSATCDPRSAATHFETFRDERLWNSILTWWAAAEKRAWSTDRQAANNCFVLWGAAGGHHDDVATLCQQLRKDASQNNYDVSVFESHARFRFLHDRVFAHRQLSEGDPEATIRLALDAGRFGDVARMLEDAPPTMPRRNLSAYRKAAELGGRLLSEGALDLTSEDAFQILFLQIEDQTDPSQSLAGVHDPRISSQDGALCWHGQEIDLTRDCYVPLGMLHGQFSGEVELPADYRRFSFCLHARGLRDVVRVNYLPASREISIVRGRRDVTRVPLPEGSVKFRFGLGPEVDVLEPASGLQFKLPVLDDVPSGVGIEVVTGPSKGVLKVRNLRFESVRDE